MDIDHLKQWIGRSETTQDLATAAPLAGLAALLDHETPPWAKGEVPPLGHWLYFLTPARQSQIDVDGHPRRGGFLPPVPLPRRLWAGGRLEFLAPVPIGAALERRSTVTDVALKSGTSGRMVFVMLRHEIFADGRLAVTEEQDLVYREAAAAAPQAGPAPQPLRVGDTERKLTPDPVQLFRYSALTFNGHRIHYDRDYARDVEGYGGLVVQGPYIATLLVDLFLRNRGEQLRRFAFRARRPLLDTAPFDLCLARNGDKFDLWTRDSQGHVTLSATAEVA